MMFKHFYSLLLHLEEITCLVVCVHVSMCIFPQLISHTGLNSLIFFVHIVRSRSSCGCSDSQLLKTYFIARFISPLTADSLLSK